MENDLERLSDELKETFKALGAPDDFKIEFADGALDGLDDIDDFIQSLEKTNQRLTGPFGWFWRWWYRPRPVKGP